MSTPDDAPPAAPARWARLVFAYEAGLVRLVAQQPIDGAYGAGEPAPAGHPGYYVDSRDADDGVLARVPARDAFARSVEVFPERAGDPITRVDVPEPKGAFTVVVPAPEAAHHVTVVQVTPPQERTAADGARELGPPAVTELASFPLRRGG